MNVLSLFSGIGGAEVALHMLRIPLKNVVSVEISEANRDIMKSWWQQTDQKGNLVHLADVKTLDPHKLEKLVKSVGGFDLIIGGIVQHMGAVPGRTQLETRLRTNKNIYDKCYGILIHVIC
ncbi:DNA (cytosine-5)-methyltransferase DRM2-like protein [Tanacetum coccineum]